MEKIIAGNFQTSVQADNAVRALKRAGFPESDLSVYANNPPGQHDQYLGGDEKADPESEGAAKGAAAGSLAGAAAGAAIGGAVGGALGAVAGAGVGAYAGSFGGAMQGLGGKEGGELPPQRRPAGTMVAVRIGDPAMRDTAIEKMSKEKPVAIEEAEGEWRDGEWADFDPVATPKVVWQGNGGKKPRKRKKPKT